MSNSPGSQKRVVLGVGGGIAAYKAVHLLRLLMDSSYYVVPILTEGAREFIGDATFSALASERAKTSLYEDPDPIPHTHLGRSADVMVVAPATANIIGKMAHGLADDLLTATLLASRAPIVIAPAMHEEMWENPAVQNNIASLKRYGVTVVSPTRGRLAGGDVGAGRMAEPSVIFDFINAVLSPHRMDLADKKVIVTSGGTREAIDPVRFVGNRSSGKQGLAFAKVAATWGAEVTLITSTDASLEFPGITTVGVESTKEMHDALMGSGSQADLVVMAAAVADFRPRGVSATKIKRAGRSELDLNMVANPDLLTEMRAVLSNHCVVVGFAAETSDLRENVEKKLSAKGVDLIVGNDVTQSGSGFGTDTNSVVVMSRDGSSYELETVTKFEVAERVLNSAASLLATH